MKKLFHKLLLLLLITTSVIYGQMPTGTTKAGKLAMYSPELGQKPDSLIVWNGTSKLLKYRPFSSLNYLPLTGGNLTGSVNIYAGFSNGQNNNASAIFSHAEGRNTISMGNYSHTEGRETFTYGRYSHTEGYLTQTGNYAEFGHAEGKNNRAYSKYSHVEGDSNVTGNASQTGGVYDEQNGAGSHAEGYSNVTQADYSHVEGKYNYTSGEGSHAEGYKTNANGLASHSEGKSTVAQGYYSHAEGNNTSANGYASHAEGDHTVANYYYQLAMGQYNDYNTTASVVIGNGNGGTRSNSVEFYYNKINYKVPINLQNTATSTGTYNILTQNPTTGEVEKVSDVRKYKVYTAIISQSGTNAPVAMVLENSLGVNIIWTRSSTGSYLGTSNYAVFTNGKSIPFITNTTTGSAANNSSIGVLSLSLVNIGNAISATLTDLNASVSVEIRVYN